MDMTVETQTVCQDNVETFLGNMVLRCTQITPLLCALWLVNYIDYDKRKSTLLIPNLGSGPTSPSPSLSQLTEGMITKDETISEGPGIFPQVGPHTF